MFQPPMAKISKKALHPTMPAVRIMQPLSNERIITESINAYHPQPPEYIKEMLSSMEASENGKSNVNIIEKVSWRFMDYTSAQFDDFANKPIEAIIRLQTSQSYKLS